MSSRDETPILEAAKAFELVAKRCERLASASAELERPDDMVLVALKEHGFAVKDDSLESITERLTLTARRLVFSEKEDEHIERLSAPFAWGGVIVVFFLFHLVGSIKQIELFGRLPWVYPVTIALFFGMTRLFYCVGKWVAQEYYFRRVQCKMKKTYSKIRATRSPLSEYIKKSFFVPLFLTVSLIFFWLQLLDKDTKILPDGLLGVAVLFVSGYIVFVLVRRFWRKVPENRT